MLGSRVRAPEGVLKEKNISSSLFFVLALLTEYVLRGYDSDLLRDL
jgi:hypothetical protein